MGPSVYLIICNVSDLSLFLYVSLGRLNGPLDKLDCGTKLGEVSVSQFLNTRKMGYTVQAQLILLDTHRERGKGNKTWILAKKRR